MTPARRRNLLVLGLSWLGLSWWAAQASPATELFDDVSGLFEQDYYGWLPTDRAELAQRYRAQLTQQCLPNPATCSYDTGRAAVKNMLDAFHDGHTSIRDPEGALRLREVQDNLSVPRTGLKVLKTAQGLLVVGVQEGSPAAKLGMQPGDLILKVNGQQAGTDQAVDNTAFVRLERQNAPLNLTYQRRNRQQTLSVQPAVLKARDLPLLSFVDVQGAGQSVSQSVGHSAGQAALIALPSFLPEDSAAQFVSQVKAAQRSGARALIVDLRYNTGGRLDQCVAAASIFGPVVYQAQFQQGGWTYAGAQGNSVLPLMAQLDTRALWTGPAAVLVGEETASCAEVFAYYARRSGAKIVGSATKGVANSGINFFALPDQGVLSLTTLRAYDDQNQPLPGRITPDVSAPTDITKLVTEGQDTTLQAALGELTAALSQPSVASKP